MSSHSVKLTTITRFFKRLTSFFAFVAAISGLLAVVGAFGAAYEARRAATASIEAVSLEMSPALQFDCNLDHVGRFPTLPSEVLFLKRGEHVQVQLSQVRTYGSDGRLFTLPAIFFRCSLTNYGKMPAFDITMHFPVTFGKMNLTADSTKQEFAFFNVPALASGASREFAIAGWDKELHARVIAPKIVKFSTITEEQEHEQRLFLSRWAFGIGSGELPPSPR